jgi:hypothetical protein
MSFEPGQMVVVDVLMTGYSIQCDGMIAKKSFKNQYGVQLWIVYVEWSKKTLEMEIPEFRIHRS